MDMLKVGERVRIPWGVDVLDGVIVEIQTGPTGGRAVVQVNLPGALEEDGEPATVTLPVTALQPADWWPDATGRTGGWATSASYERHISEALERILRNHRNANAHYAKPGRDLGYDILVDAPEGQVAVTAKYFARQRVGTGRIWQLIKTAQKVAETLERANLILLITNIDVSRALTQEQISSATELDVPIRVVTWRSQSDDTSLANAIEPWLRDDGEEVPIGVE